VTLKELSNQGMNPFERDYNLIRKLFFFGWLVFILGKGVEYLIQRDDHYNTVSTSEIIETIGQIDIYLFQSGVINGKYINTAATWVDFKKSLKKDAHAVSEYYKRRDKLVLDINYVEKELSVYVHVGTITFDLGEVRKFASQDDFVNDDLYDDSILDCCFGRMEFE